MITAFSGIKGEARAKRMLLGALKTGRIPPAYLFCGHDSEEMKAVAVETAKALNCDSVCGSCLSCRKIENLVYPDLIIVTPEGKKGIIKIDTVRQVKERIKIGPTEGSYLVAVFESADMIEAAAANSFLKMLEEPPQKVLFVLTTTRPGSILKTIISRCQKIIFSGVRKTDQEEAVLPEKTPIYELLEYSGAFSAGHGETERRSVEKKLEAVLERYAATKRVRESKIVLGSITKIRRMGNIRITLDDMVLKLGGAVK